MKKIENTVRLGNLTMTVENYLKQWATYAGCDLRRMDFKRDLSSWNTGDTALKPKVCYGCYQYDRDEDSYLCKGIYQIWQNSFCLTEVFFFSEDEYNNYTPSQEAPDAIKNEIGLCKDYHKGI